MAILVEPIPKVVIDPVLPILDYAVRICLRRVGNRLLTRHLRGTLRDVPLETIYLHVEIHPDQIDSLLAGCCEHFDQIAPLVNCTGPPLCVTLTHYLSALLFEQHPHDPAVLNAVWQERAYLAYGERPT